MGHRFIYISIYFVTQNKGTEPDCSWYPPRDHREVKRHILRVYGLTGSDITASITSPRVTTAIMRKVRH